MYFLKKNIFFQFPLCDGSHNDHNKETKDNVGPVVIRHKPDSTPK